MPRDPAILSHLDRGNPTSIYRVTRRILDRAADTGDSPIQAANHLADQAIPTPHPIHHDRAQRIIASLTTQPEP